MPDLDDYAIAFSRLRTDRGRDRYPAQTLHRAPHKPFLLLSVMDLVMQGQIRDNFIEPSFELLEVFNGYWNLIMPPESRSSMAYPFPRLQTDGFWHRVTHPGFDPSVDYNVSSMVRLREIYKGAELDRDLFAYFIDPVSRERLRSVLVDTYFAPDIQPIVAMQGFVNIAAFAYAKDILAGMWQRPENHSEEQTDQRQIRCQGFRKAIVALYDHRCALCGIRMRTPEGHTVVEAAHIVPWSESYNDLPTNGLCLCRLCHWSFDEGLMGVGKDYEVLVSNRVRLDSNMPGHILTLVDRPIFKPKGEQYWPAQENLNKHRKMCFS